MNVFRDFERKVDEKLRKLFQSSDIQSQPDRRRELIEIQRSILDEVADHVQLLPRARKIFPFNDVHVTIPAPEAERRAAMRVVFADGDALEEEIRKHLVREEVEVPADLKVSVELPDQEMPDLANKGYHLRFGTREAAAAPATPKIESPPSEVKSVRLTVLAGTSEQPTLQLSKRRVQVGRISEVLDDRRRLVRRNDLVFSDSADEINATVSRAHARIELDPSGGEFRLYDEGSAYGTSVLQDGRLINVPKAGVRGLRLNSGDEIYFGQARVLFEIV